MKQLLYVLIPALMAGLIQGTTGFGSGIVMMIFLPLQFSVLESSAISGVLGLSLCIAMVWRYRKYVSVKLILWPAVLFSLSDQSCDSICTKF